VQLSNSACIHLVFHVLLLKKAVENYRVEENLPINLEDDNSYQPEVVLAAHTITKAGDSVLQLLMHWKEKTVDVAT